MNKFELTHSPKKFCLTEIGGTFFGDMLFFLNGEIIESGGNYYFEDKTLNDRHFLITDYDFNSDWDVGFPYKSGATISAPIGDAVLIAADINNFLYNGVGIPNQIPVISFFQDIDYEHKLFCRHVDQVVDSDGIETTEPRIVDIVLYDTVRTGDDLIECQSYFEIPTEITGASSVPGDYANNTTAIATLADGAIIYNKTGIKTETAQLNLTKAVTIKGIGYSVNDYGDAPANLISFAAGKISMIEGLIFSGKDTIDLGVRSDADGIRISKTKIYELFPDWTFIKEAGTGLHLNDCIFIGEDNSQELVLSAPDLHVKGCYINGSFAVGMFGTTAGVTEEQTVEYCKIITKDINQSHIILVSSMLQFNFNYNNVAITGAGHNILVFGMDTANCILNIKYNKFYISGTIGATFYLISNALPLTGTLNFEYNNFQAADGNGRVFYLPTSKSSIIRGNYIRQNVCHLQYEHIATSVLVEKNILESYGSDVVGTLAGIIISPAVGQETADILIQKNKILNPKHFDDTLSGLHDCIFICDYFDSVVKYNYVSGGGEFNIILKSATNIENTECLCIYNISKMDGLLSKGQGYVKFYNNTIVDAITAGLTLMNGDDDSNHKKCYVKNNIIVNSTDSSPLVNIINEATGGNNEIDYNVYYSTAAKPFKYEGVTKTFAEWQALGFDTNSIFLTSAQFDDLFNDFTNNDYSLKTGSVAISAGVNLGALYNEGLDSATNWGAGEELPSIITKQQDINWDVGAYIS